MILGEVQGKVAVSKHRITVSKDSVGWKGP